MKILKASLEKEEVAEAIAALEQGKVLMCPTDTVYGLVADATNQQAVQKVFLIKGREQGKPLPIFVADIAQAKELAEISAEQEVFLQKAWPGKVTAVLQSKGALPKETGTAERIGLRIPSHPLVLSLLLQLGKPLTGTSANLSGEPAARDSAEVIKQFLGREHAPDILVDAGVLPFSAPSTVVDITGAIPLTLRP